MQKIKLTQGKFTVVSNEDYGVLSQHKWYARKDLNTFYAQRKVKQPDGKWKIVLMHREILVVPQGLFVDHLNRNGLDNRRENIRICTHQENMMNMRKRKDNSSGVTGLYWHKRDEAWYGVVNYCNKAHSTKTFKFKKDALAALKQLRQDRGV